jgi:hypothetical protein
LPVFATGAFENGYNEWFARALDVVIGQWFRLSRLAAPPDRLRNDSLVNQEFNFVFIRFHQWLRTISGLIFAAV